MAKGKSNKNKKRNTAAKPVLSSDAKAQITETSASQKAIAPEKSAKDEKGGKNVVKSSKEKAPAKGKNATKAVKKSSDKKPNVFQRLMQYFHDVKSELKRVTWPTKPEVINSSFVVIGALIFFGILIFVVDSVVVPVLTAYSGLAG